MLSRFRGPAASTWFGTIYVFRCVPYISWVLPLYFVTQSWGIYDTYIGLLLPHIAVHICFFSCDLVHAGGRKSLVRGGTARSIASPRSR